MTWSCATCKRGFDGCDHGEEDVLSGDDYGNFRSEICYRCKWSNFHIVGEVDVAMGSEGPTEAELLLELLAGAHMRHGDDDPSSPYYPGVPRIYSVPDAERMRRLADKDKGDVGRAMEELVRVKRVKRVVRILADLKTMRPCNVADDALNFGIHTWESVIAVWKQMSVLAAQAVCTGAIEQMETTTGGVC